MCHANDDILYHWATHMQDFLKKTYIYLCTTKMNEVSILAKCQDFDEFLYDTCKFCPLPAKYLVY